MIIIWINIQKKYHFSLIKKFYKKILPLKCFESLYNAIYDDSYYPFKDKKFTEYFIDNYYDFIPIQNNNAFAMTEKFSMRTLINTFLPGIEGGNCSKEIKMILRHGFIIVISSHEIVYNFVNIYFYMENSRKSIQTPRKNNLDISEERYFIEIALYGRKLETINLKQALYVLNENNYNKTYLEFQEGFNLLKEEDLTNNGIFKQLSEKIDLNNINLNNKVNSFISLKSQSQDKESRI